MGFLIVLLLQLAFVFVLSLVIAFIGILVVCFIKSPRKGRLYLFAFLHPLSPAIPFIFVCRALRALSVKNMRWILVWGASGMCRLPGEVAWS